MDNWERVEVKGELVAIIVRKNFKTDGIHFFTDNDLTQQLAYMSHPKGHKIEPHYHREAKRVITATCEALFIVSGAVRVDFYDFEWNVVEHRIIKNGDVILLIAGGHGFEVIEEAVFFEVKQGPFVASEDKVKRSDVIN